MIMLTRDEVEIAKEVLRTAAAHGGSHIAAATCLMVRRLGRGLRQQQEGCGLGRAGFW